MYQEDCGVGMFWVRSTHEALAGNVAHLDLLEDFAPTKAQGLKCCECPGALQCYSQVNNGVTAFTKRLLIYTLNRGRVQVRRLVLSQIHTQDHLGTKPFLCIISDVCQIQE